MTWPEWTSPDGRIRLINADCLEVLPELDGIDAIVADPPYGIGWSDDSRTRARLALGKPARPIEGDDRPFDPRPLLAFDIPTILWGANNYADKLPPCYGWIVWDKRPGGECNSQSDCELAWTNFLGSVRKHSQRWMGIMRDGHECPFVGGALIHPNQKPEALMRFCVGKLPPGCEMILDPYAGSMTTALACYRLNRRCIAIEKEAKYFDIGVKRMKAEIARTALIEEACA